jgi:hypothetical protein
MLTLDNSNSASTPIIIKCDKNKVSNQLALADPRSGLGTKTPSTRAHWLIKTPQKLFSLKKNNQPHVMMAAWAPSEA